MEKNELKWLVFGEIISADSEMLEEPTKQAILSRFNSNDTVHDWKYILEPIEDITLRERLIKLLEYEKD